MYICKATPRDHFANLRVFSSGLFKVHVHAFHFFSFLLSFKFSDYVSKVVCVTFIIIITAQFCLELNIFFIMKPNKKHATNMYIKMFCIWIKKISATCETVTDTFEDAQKLKSKIYIRWNWCIKLL